MRFPRGRKHQIPFRLRSQRAIKYRSRRGSGSGFNAVLIITESGSIRSLREHVVAPNAAGGIALRHDRTAKSNGILPQIHFSAGK
jgi:hypothetical protein